MSTRRETDDLAALLDAARRMADHERRLRLGADPVFWFVRGLLAARPDLAAEDLHAELKRAGIPVTVWRRAAQGPTDEEPRTSRRLRSPRPAHRMTDAAW